MPIADEVLQSDVNAYLAMPANATVQAAVTAWRNGHERWGTAREWWWLIIQHTDGMLTAIPFEQLRDLLMDKANAVSFNTPLYALPAARQAEGAWKLLPGVVKVHVVNKQAHGTAAAISLAENSPGHLIAVTDKGQVVGIINKRMRNFAMANQSLMALFEAFEMEQTSDAVPPSSGTSADSPPPMPS